MDHKKILLGLVLVALIGVVSFQAYNFTTALFSDTEATQDSTFTAGTLDMDVDGNNGTAFDNIVVSNIGVDGTVSGGKTWTITNSGSVPGQLALTVLGVQNHENGCNEPEALVDSSCDTPGTGQGELGGAIATAVLVDTGAGDVQYVSTDLATANEGQYATQWNASPAVIIPAGGSVTVTMNWSNDPASYGNEIQGDSLDFDVQFDLTQVTPS